ncbi:hypothetical protein HKD37_18G051071 [Glycine soja]
MGSGPNLGPWAQKSTLRIASKSLVIHFSRDASTQKPRGFQPILGKKPIPFPYKSDKAVPWRLLIVKIKSLDVTSLKELGRLIGPLQRQAFRKVYGKILDLTTAEVFTEAVVSLAQYYDQPLRCFTIGDFQIVPTVEEFEEILGCPLGGRKPYLFSGFLPSLSRIAAVVGDSTRELDRVKQTRNGVVGLPRKYLEGKARDMETLLIFGVVLFPNVDGLVGLARIDAFLAYHHGKESPVVAILAELFDTFDRRFEKNSARIVCCLPALCVWLVSHLFQQDIRHLCPLQSYDSCIEKRRVDWDQYLAGIGGSTINWFPRRKEGKEGVLFSCGDYPNVPLIGTRGCINYNPTLAIRQLGYPMRGAPTEESLSPFLVRDFGTQSLKIVQRVHKAWKSPLRKDKELRDIHNGIIGGYHEWLREELAACSISKRSLAQHLEATEQSMLAIIGQYKEELNQSLTHEQKLVEDFTQAYAKKEARGRSGLRKGKFEYASNVAPNNNRRVPVVGTQKKEGDTHAVTTAPTWMKAPQNSQNSYQHNPPNFSIRAGSSLPTQVEGPPAIEKTPAQHTAPATPRPANNTTPGASYNNAWRPPKDEFSPIPMAYSELWPSLLENHLVVAIPGKVFQPPYPKWYNSNATCVYHSGAPGHNIDSCLPFKYKVQHLINVGWLSFQEEGPNVKTNPLANHGGSSVNAIEKDGPSGSKRFKDAACMVSRGGGESNECLFHLGESHDMETCPTVEELLQRLMDWGQLEVSKGNREEPQICMQSEERKVPPTPKALVICFTRDVTGSRPMYPLTAPKPNAVVPWKYTPPAFGEKAATEVDSLSAKVTNITGLSGITRSGRVFAPPHLAELPSKGKAPMIQEPADVATPLKEVDPPVVKGAEKKEGLQGKAVTLEEAHEFLRLIQQSEFKVVEQLNKTPARISLLELLINSEPHPKESLETTFQSFDVVSCASVETSPSLPCLSNAALMVARVMLRHGYKPEIGLGKDNHGNADVVDIRGNLYKYGLGYEPGKPGRRNAPSRLRADRAWPDHVSQCFTSVGIMFEEEVAAIGEESPQDLPSFMRPCHPNSQVGN